MLVAELLDAWNKPIDARVAHCLYAGLTTDRFYVAVESDCPCAGCCNRHSTAIATITAFATGTAAAALTSHPLSANTSDDSSVAPASAN